MMNKYKGKKLLLIAGVVASVFFFVFFAEQSNAQNNTSLSLSVTPPLFQLSITPGEYWASSVKVVNSNPYPLTVRAEVVMFDASGETGNAKFLPVLGSEGTGKTLAEWVTLESERIVIPPERSGSVPFTVRIPEDAPPGGHYAAILIGNESEANPADGPQIGVSSFVSSLLFVKIAGDIEESGMIREFTSNKSLYQRPEASFSLRFENKGNVHLLPQGEITIYNMWGKKRGVVPINQQTDFGNVLPKSIRKFDFSWTGERNPLEVGRYKAIATLTYGQEERQSVYATAYFYVIPVVPVLILLASLIVVILFISWVIKLYVRRALELQGIYDSSGEFLSPDMSRRHVDMKMLTNPIVEGVMDLRHVTHHAESDTNVTANKNTSPSTAKEFFRKYKRFFGGMLGMLGIGFLGFIFFNAVLIPERGFDVRVEKSDGSIEISSEELIKKTLQEKENYFNQDPVEQQSLNESASTTLDRSTVDLVVLNASGVPGKGAEIAVLLEKAGYMISRIGNAKEEEKVELHTVIANHEATSTAEFVTDIESIANMSFIKIQSNNNEEEKNRITIIVGKSSE
ncbi:MAG: LytR C-terminal domain-containing protein [Candidatus Paceibacterota bacterium]